MGDGFGTVADLVTGPDPDLARPARALPVAGPSITDHEIDAVTEAVRSAWYESANEVTDRFEASFAVYVGRRHAVTVPSCTAALHLALAALGIGEGDEVVVPDATWIASSAPITYVGATPVFADIDPVTWCVDPASVRSVITERTRAVIAVDLYGGMVRFGELREICDPLGVAVIEDAAEAIGSAHHGRLAGSFGAMSTFSFHGSKTLTTGEGGMLVTDDDEVHQRVLQLRDHGRRPGDTTFFNTEVAFKYKMSALQAALGQAQLDRIDELVASKRQIFEWYSERLGDVEHLTLNSEPDHTFNSYWMSTVVLGAEVPVERDALIDQLARSGIATRPFFHPLSALPAYADATDAPRARDANAISREVGRRGLNLPSALRLTEDEVDYACRRLMEIIEG